MEATGSEGEVHRKEDNSFRKAKNRSVREFSLPRVSTHVSEHFRRMDGNVEMARRDRGSYDSAHRMEETLVEELCQRAVDAHA